MTAAASLALLALFLHFVDSHRIQKLENQKMTIDDQLAQLQSDADAAKANFATYAQKIADLSAQLAAGQPLTADQQAKFNTIHQELSALAAPTAPPNQPAPAPAS